MGWADWDYKVSSKQNYQVLVKLIVKLVPGIDVQFRVYFDPMFILADDVKEHNRHNGDGKSDSSGRFVQC